MYFVLNIQCIYKRTIKRIVATTSDVMVKYSKLNLRCKEVVFLEKKTLGQRIKEERLNQQMTQKVLAGDYITRNMLSQIENDQAKPSITTIEYLAKQLNRPVGYFMDEKSKVEELSDIVKELLVEYHSHNCKKVLETLHNIQHNNPQMFKHDILKDIYINCNFKEASSYKERGMYKEAKSCYLNLLALEDEMMMNADVMLYKIYNQLVEVTTFLGEMEEAHQYDERAKKTINKLVSTREVQGMYLKLTQGLYQEALECAEEIDANALDSYNKARYNMVVGTSYYYLKQFEKAITYLEEAVYYYEDKTYNSILVMMCEELSKCFTHLEDYQKAIVYMQKAERSKAGGS